MKTLFLKIIILWGLWRKHFSESTIKYILANIRICDGDILSRFFLYLRFHGGIKAIDIDGVLCEEQGRYEYRKSKFFKIEREYKYIVLFTARLAVDRALTLEWLKKNHIDYDALITNKLPYDILIDDKANNYG